MTEPRIESKWIDAFRRVLEMCAVRAGDAVAILSETQSRGVNVQLAELAALGLGARAFHVVVPTPRQTAPVPIRSTGASDAIQGLVPVIQALGTAALVIDCTVEGLLHAKELGAILQAGARVLMVSNEHP
ncbi:MAG TPA: peptidase M29, partial [Candidatus Binatia bacterium]|nr:peptidase M29 [Candidatus Binatia bacterium]